jgi:hypothetical protein
MEIKLFAWFYSLENGSSSIRHRFVINIGSAISNFPFNTAENAAFFIQDKGWGRSKQ